MIACAFEGLDSTYLEAFFLRILRVIV